MASAFSYLRFSSPQQASGDSIRRQTEKTLSWCERNKVQLDTSVTLKDMGVSAFKGKHRENPDTNALAGFLQAVRAGRIPAGSYLVVESLDRLSREKIRPALTLLLNLIEQGVRVVQLSPVEQVYDEDVEPMTLMMAVMELNRGHSESAMKSLRVGSAWANKRKHAAERVVTRKLPGWIKYDDGKLKLDPAGAATIRRVYDMACDAMGVAAIAKQLNAEKVPVLGRATYKGRPVVWSETVVYHLLTSRATIGEFQPCKGRGSERVPTGDPLTNYFPPIITSDRWHAAQAALKSRSKRGSGKRGKHINLFSGLLVDARDGGSLTYKHLANRPSALIPVGAKHGRGTKWSSFPASPFEDAILSELVEVKTKDVKGDDAADRVEAATGELAEAEAKVKFYRAKCEESPEGAAVFADTAIEWEKKRKERAEKLDAAQRDAATPIAKAWGEFKSLAEMMKGDTSDELRVKVKAALRRSIESVHCLFTGAGRLRLAAVRVQFRGTDRHREYVVSYDPGRSNHHVKRPGVPNVRSFADAGLKPDALDLRKPSDASALEKALVKITDSRAGVNAATDE